MSGRSASSLLKIQLTMSDLVLPTIPGEEVLKVAENRNLWYLILNQGLESLDKEDVDAIAKTLLVYKAAAVGVHGSR